MLATRGQSVWYSEVVRRSGVERWKRRRRQVVSCAGVFMRFVRRGGLGIVVGASLEFELVGEIVEIIV